MSSAERKSEDSNPPAPSPAPEGAQSARSRESWLLGYLLGYPLNSLKTRLLLASMVVLLVFMVLTGWVINSALKSSSLQAEEEKMQGMVYALLAAAEMQNGVLVLQEQNLPDPRFRQLGSGLEAAILNEHGEAIWLSASSGGRAPPDLKPPPIGEWRFYPRPQAKKFLMLFGLRWLDGNTPRFYAITVQQSDEEWRRFMRRYRQNLILGLIVTGLILLIAQVLILRWGLSPVRKLVDELSAIERGQQGHIEAEYPLELAPLTQGLNTMLTAERHQQVRYRNALGDLAHSLKTPLAVLHGLLEEKEERSLSLDMRRQLLDQLSRMQQITDYQLRKAATAGRRALSEPVVVRAVAEKIIAAIAKVYASKIIGFQLEIPPKLTLRADAGDLYEIFGNLIDNAAKYGGKRIIIRAWQEKREFVLTVEDSGTGFPEEAEKLLTRGVRADSATLGQGIGLAAVLEVVSAYEGEIALKKSERLGGAYVELRLPT
jgi:two-component system sensor histidine kinase PhoQ